MAKFCREIPCPSCTYVGARHGRVVHGYDVFICEECGLAFTYPRPSEEDVAAFYHSLALGEDLYGGQSPMKRAFFELCHREIDRHLKSGRILDFGCGDGCFLNEGDSSMFSLYGADLHSGIEKIPHKNKIEFLIGNNLDVNIYGNYFDVIFTSATYEHFIDPVEMTDKFIKLLKPGGIIFIVSVPSYNSFNIKLHVEDWLINRPPAHINFFTIKSLTKNLVSAGFVIEKRWTYGFNLEPVKRRLKGLSAETSLKTLVESGATAKSGTVKPVGLLHKIAATIYFRFPYLGVGDKLALIARKPEAQ